ncbi:DNA replication/repair protein RecF [Limnochorda pilosa]|uniref:DNA replication and repair protein RecF n=1 Tax=Limnochorda pilosa TaxID=1555112 RepID=A0A0K2SFK4_LIMPI|nr:DNA replication/repair protein RecF [Limnochorda pilosa]BAS25865.1 DNA replication and repair protein RecF [Limnochorda pilosa]
MQIHALELTSFRNYGHLSLPLAGKLHLFLGGNGQGKTNLLEAVYLVATGRSMRAGRDEEMIAWGSPEARVRLDAESLRGRYDLRVDLSRRGKRVYVNGSWVRRLGDLLEYFSAVLFVPDDLGLVKGGPEARRRFLDAQLVQALPAYREAFTSFHRVLKQRNRLLEQIASGARSPAGLDEWDDSFVEHAAAVIQRRAEAVSTLSPLAAEAHGKVAGRKALTLRYRPYYMDEGAPDEVGSPEEIRAQVEASLERVRPMEMRRGSSLVGPQRDDLEIALDGRPARLYASQGEQRTVVLACKVAELELVAGYLGEYPVLLLDDVLSELDPARQAAFVDVAIGRTQTLVTSTEASGLPVDLRRSGRSYRVREGQVSPEA